MGEVEHSAHCDHCWRQVELDTAALARAGYHSLYGLVGLRCLRCGNPGKAQLVPGKGTSGVPWHPPSPPPAPPDAEILRAGTAWVPQCRWPPVPPWVTETATRWEYETICGRFAFFSPLDATRPVYGFAGRPNIEPRWNIAPTEKVAAVRLVGGERRIELLQWGLIPWWARDARISATLINLRAEALLLHPPRGYAPIEQRCLVLADGYYEWRAEGGTAQPYYFSRRDGQPFAFAGFWARNAMATGAPVESCGIVVTAPIGADAATLASMPAALTPPQATIWLNPNAARDQLRGCLQAVNPMMFRAWPVAPQVNSPKIDEPACIQPTGATSSALDIMPQS